MNARRARVLGRLAMVALLALGGCARDVVHEPDEEHDGGRNRLTYDPQTVQTLRGRIVEVQGDRRISGSKHGVRALVDTGTEQLYVYLAPEEYFAEVSLELRAGQEIAVRGSVLDGDGRRVVIAQSIEIGVATYPLRDADGRPRWREWRSSREWK